MGGADLLIEFVAGWRLDEVLALQLPQVDLVAGIARLEPGNTKNRDGRQLHLGAIDGNA